MTQPYEPDPRYRQPLNLPQPYDPQQPGLGTMYAGEVTWGVVILMWVLSWIALFFVVGFITLPIVWIVSLIAAYSAAQKWNRAHGIIS